MMHDFHNYATFYFKIVSYFPLNNGRSVAHFFPSFQAYCNTKLEVDYRFPLHFYLLNALSLFCGLLRAIGLRHRGPLISNSVNIRGDDKAFYIGLRRHQIPPLGYSSSRMGFHYTFSFPRSQSNKHCIYYSTTVDAGVSIFAGVALARPFLILVILLFLNQRQCTRSGREAAVHDRHTVPSMPTE